MTICIFFCFEKLAAHRVLPGLTSWPFISESRRSGTAPREGLWSIEPHLAIGSLGLKWEELLVVEKGQARWLDESNPLM